MVADCGCALGAPLPTLSPPAPLTEVSQISRPTSAGRASGGKSRMCLRLIAPWTRWARFHPSQKTLGFTVSKATRAGSRRRHHHRVAPCLYVPLQPECAESPIPFSHPPRLPPPPDQHCTAVSSLLLRVRRLHPSVLASHSEIPKRLHQLTLGAVKGAG